MKRYKIEVKPVKYKDGTAEWCAEFPAVKGCIGVGSTAEEAIKEAFANLDFHLDALRKAGLPIPMEDDHAIEYSGKVLLRMSKSLHQQIAHVAEQEGTSLNSFINEALTYKIAKLS